MSTRGCYQLITVVICLVSEIKTSVYSHSHRNPNQEEDIGFHHIGLEPVCADSLCYNQEDCCYGAVCITHGSAKVGVCAKLMAQPEGKLCTVAAQDDQCAGDMECRPIHLNVLPLGICVNPNKIPQHKKYFETCETTMDCEMSAKLCCRIQTPAKGKNRKICSYYDAPLEQCIF
jgi:hypothetical protein